MAVWIVASTVRATGGAATSTACSAIFPSRKSRNTLTRLRSQLLGIDEVGVERRPLELRQHPDQAGRSRGQVSGSDASPRPLSAARSMP